MTALTPCPPCSIIAYVLLCGYSPFRGDDTHEMIRETTEAKIEFHERYWSKVSNEGALMFDGVSCALC